MAVDEMIIRDLLGRRGSLSDQGYNSDAIESETMDAMPKPMTFAEMKAAQANPETQQALSAEEDPTVLAARRAMEQAVQQGKDSERKNKIQRGLNALGAAIDPNTSYTDLDKVQTEKEKAIQDLIDKKTGAYNESLAQAAARRRQEREAQLQLSQEGRAQAGFETTQDRAAAAEERAVGAEGRAQELYEREIAAADTEADLTTRKGDPTSAISVAARYTASQAGIEVDDSMSAADLEGSGIDVGALALQMLKDKADLEKERLKQDAKGPVLSDFQETMQKEEAKSFAERQAAAQDIPEKLNTIDRMLGLLDEGVSTGFEQRVPGLGGALRLGEKTQEFEKLSAQLQLDAADQLSGVLSDSDMALLRGSVANLQTSEGANTKVLQEARTALERAAKEAARQRDYVTQNGSLAGYSSPYLEGGVSTPAEAAEPAGKTVVRRSRQADGSVIVEYSDGTFGEE